MGKAMEKPETIIFAWFVAFSTIIFMLTLNYPDYDINTRATTAALLTTPFAFVALYNTQKN
ncbi:MAG: hypothetical protein ACYDEF_16345 [Methanosarcina sp.]|jgi:hypothetical protein